MIVRGMQTHLAHLCATSFLVAAGSGIVTAQPMPRVPEATRVSASDRFAFHSDPWINLHHFLYQWSREDRGLEIGRHPLPMPERSTVNGLSAADRSP